MTGDDVVWSETTIGEVAEHVRYGFTESAVTEPVGPKFLRITDIQDDSVDWATVPYCRCDDLDRFAIRDGDIVVARTGATTGKSWLVRGAPSSAVYASYLLSIRPGTQIEPAFLAAVMRSPMYWRQIQSLAKGSAQPGVNAAVLRSVRFNVPPLDDQRRIVAHLDACFERTKRAKKALDELPALLDRLRQSILAAAFRGDLTADWRAENPDVEPASELLKRIRVERRRRWEDAELAKMVGKGKAPKDDKWKAKYEEPEPVDESELPELPEGWCWASVDEVTSFVTSGSRGWSEFYANEGPLFLRVANVPRGAVDIDLSDMQRVAPPANAEGERTRVQAGDMLITITADLGRVAVIEGDLETAYVSQHVGLARPVFASLARSWAHFLSGPVGQRLLLARNRGATKAGLGLDDLRATAVPVMPDAEATILVERIDGALAKALIMRDALHEAEQFHVELERTILASAFARAREFHPAETVRTKNT